jgi:hypothetical protein
MTSTQPMGRRRFRFSLGAMLLAVTACAVFLGYAEWRRRWMVEEYAALRAEGLTLQPLSGTWWPEAPPVALIIFRPSKIKPGMLSHYRSYYSADEAVRRARDWQARLRRLGVPIVDLFVGDAKGPKKLTRVNDPDDLRIYVRTEGTGE